MVLVPKHWLLTPSAYCTALLSCIRSLSHFSQPHRTVRK